MQVQDPLVRYVPGVGLGRDPARTPMQWNASPHGGFTTGQPWLPVSKDSSIVNVEAQRRDGTSVLSLYRRLIAIRRTEAALAIGAYQTFQVDENIFSFVRRYGARRLLIGLNMTSSPAEIDLMALHTTGRIALSTYLDRAGQAVEARLRLRADEGVLVDLSAEAPGGAPMTSDEGHEEATSSPQQY